MSAWSCSRRTRRREEEGALTGGPALSAGWRELAHAAWDGLLGCEAGPLWDLADAGHMRKSGEGEAVGLRGRAGGGNRPAREQSWVCVCSSEEGKELGSSFGPIGRKSEGRRKFSFLFFLNTFSNPN